MTNSKGIQYEFSAKIWYSEWYFVSLPKDMSDEIRKQLKFMEEGWGRMKITAKIGNTEWKTAIWFDTKNEAYLLPLKAEIRKKEKLETDREVAITIWI